MMPMDDTLLNIPRVYTALAEWLFASVFILYSRKRYSKPMSATLMVLSLGGFIAYQTFAGSLSLEWWIPTMFGAVLLMAGYILWLTTLRPSTVVYFTAFAFVLAEFTASLEWQLYYFFVVNTDWAERLFVEGLFVAIIYGALFIGTVFFERRYRKQRVNRLVERSDLISVVAIGFVVFSLGNLNFLEINSPFTGRYPAEIFYIRTLVLLSGVILLYTHREHRLATATKLDLAATKTLLDSQYEKYRLSKETIELINHRYHDLKHQIGLIRSETNPDKKEAYLQALEQDVKGYQHLFETGNHVLDTLISSKQHQIEEHNIQFTCVADGTLLKFMNVIDVVSLFGNALDNAIESVKKIKNEDKRIIKLSIFKQGNLVMIRIENYYEEPLKYDNGAFLTTKSNKMNHGYGLRSIERVARSYDGSLTIKTENNWFKLFILIPMANNSQHQ